MKMKLKLIFYALILTNFVKSQENEQMQNDFVFPSDDDENPSFQSRFSQIKSAQEPLAVRKQFFTSGQSGSPRSYTYNTYNGTIPSGYTFKSVNGTIPSGYTFKSFNGSIPSGYTFKSYNGSIPSGYSVRNISRVIPGGYTMRNQTFFFPGQVGQAVRSGTYSTGTSSSGSGASGVGGAAGVGMSGASAGSYSGSFGFPGFYGSGGMSSAGASSMSGSGVGGGSGLSGASASAGSSSGSFGFPGFYGSGGMSSAGANSMSGSGGSGGYSGAGSSALSYSGSYGGAGGAGLSGASASAGSQAFSPNAYNIQQGKFSSACKSAPRVVNAQLKCDMTQGMCRANCITDYLFPNKQQSVLFGCQGTTWVAQNYPNENEEIPSCEPVCFPECKNNGICIKPGVCKCPENYMGPQCQTEKKFCLKTPPTPANSRRSCSPSLCTISCMKGYKFPDASITSVNVECKDGEWVSTSAVYATIPDCIPTCDPECLNGGTCLSYNVCQCTKAYRGPICQYSIDNCSPKKLGFNGGYNCTGTSNDVTCRLYCPTGIDFEYAPAESYTCTYATAEFLPKQVPNCAFPPGMQVVMSDPIQQYGVVQGNGTFIKKSGGRRKKIIKPAEEEAEYDYDDGEETIETTIVKKTKKIKRKRKKAKSGEKYEYEDYEDEYEQIPGVYSMYMVEGAGITYLTPKASTCMTWNGNKVKTFDGLTYRNELYCSHVLIKDFIDGTFSVILRSCPHDSVQPCPHALEVFLQSNQYTFENINGQVKLATPKKTIPIPCQMAGLKVTRSGLDIRIYLESVPMTIIWDTKKFIQIDVTPSIWNRTAGLCGTLDGKTKNDFMSKDGTYHKLPSTFVDSWKMPTLDKPEQKCEMEKEDLMSSECETSVEEKANMVCTDLIKNIKLKNCVKLFNEDNLMQNCISDYCYCKDTYDRTSCICSGIDVVVKDCIFKGISLPEDWRDFQICPINCTNGRVYKSCGPVNEPSCGSAIEENTLDCREGCFCPNGMILSEGDCIKPEFCPCKLKGRVFKPKSSIMKDCNTCTCENGSWKCTDQTCGARCSAIGDPHYSTFDGKQYDFMGKCSYYLLKTKGLTIEGENVACSGAISESMNLAPAVSTDLPSCTKSVTIRFKENANDVVIQLKQGGIVVVNNQEIKLPKLYMDGALKIRHPSSNFVLVDFLDSVKIWWDGVTRVYIDAPASMRGQTEGLCGTFNSNMKDDFLTPEGDIETVVEPFADKWKTEESCPFMSDRPVTHPCQVNVENKAKAEQICAKLKSEIFEDCHWFVEPDQFYDDCLYDVCACKGDVNQCACPILSSYVAECARQGYVLNWRHKVQECDVKCPPGQIFEQCGEACSRSCSDLQSEPGSCKLQCIEGCRCPPGQVLDDNGECVLTTMCKCKYKSLEFNPSYKEVRPGKKFLELCTCINGTWTCVEAKTGDAARFPPAGDISKKCSKANNEIFSTCEPTEPITCKNMHQYEGSTPAECRPGCVCKDGYVLDVTAKKCVLPEDCSCHHGGKSYNDGEKIQEDCNTCTCRGGKWQCTNRQCGGQCVAWGDSHFITFDGKEYDFQGVCSYVLSKGQIDGDGYSVTIQNVLCGSNGVTCSKSVTISIFGASVESLTLSSEINSIGLKDKDIVKSSDYIFVNRAGVYVLVEIPHLGVQIKWDRGTRVYIKLQNRWKNKVQGLCGNFNFNAQDDLTTPSAGVESNPILFGHSWKLDESCEMPTDLIDSCTLNAQRKTWSQKKCGILKSSIFSVCHSEVPVDNFWKRCIFDTCACDQGGDCECLCTALATYAAACAEKGIKIKWRTPDLCPMQCDPKCSKYSPCISACPVETCENVMQARPDKMCKEDLCIEGCELNKCPEGYVFSNGTFIECVPAATCKPVCMVANGKTYYEGDIISSDECHTCTCARGKKICSGVPCIPKSNDTSREADVGCISGWSSWINQDKLDVSGLDKPSIKQNDEEPLPSDMQMKNLYGLAVCSSQYLSAIECRTVVGHKSPKSTGQNVECSLEKGLLCIGNCFDYEIRVLCDCGDMDKPPVTKTPVVIPVKPTISPEKFPTLPPIKRKKTRKEYIKICDPTIPHAEHPLSCYKFLHCIQSPNGTFIWAEKTCNPPTMFHPISMVCEWPESVMKVKPICKTRPQLLPEEDYDDTTDPLVPGDLTLVTTLKPVTLPPVVPITIQPAKIIELTTPSDIKKRKKTGSLICDLSSPQTVPHPHLCNKYYQCEPTALGIFEYVSKDCSPATMYNPISKVCDFPSSVIAVRPECASELEPTTTQLPIATTTVVSQTEKKKKRRYKKVLTVTCDPATPLLPHPYNCHSFLQCEPNSQGGFEYAVKTCNPPTMFHPVTMICDWPQSVIAVKPKCGKPVNVTESDAEYEYTEIIEEEEESTVARNRTRKRPVSIDEDYYYDFAQTKELCDEGFVYNKCAYPCGRACRYYKYILVKKGVCSRDSADCVPGCIPEENLIQCKYPKRWRDEKTCVEVPDCTCVTDDNKIVKPGQVIQVSECKTCQCIKNEYICIDTGCTTPVNATKPPVPIIVTTPMPIIVPSTLAPPTQCEPSRLIPIASSLPDSSFTASSELSEAFQAKNGRLDSKAIGQSSGSWSPQQSDQNQYLQIAFPAQVPIFGVIVKGSALFDQYVTSFKILHSYDGVVFHYLVDESGSPQIFSGGFDSKTPIQSLFKVPIETKYIRIYPVTWHDYIALRAEILGCQRGQLGQLGDTGIRPPRPTTIKPVETITTTPTPVTLPVPTQCEPTKLNPISSILPDYLFSASSQLSEAFQPKYSRLNSKPVGQSSGSWSPQQSNQNEYLQIIFPTATPIYGVTIKGSPLFDQYVTSYKVLQSNDGVTFKPLLDDFGSPQIFTGNKDSKSPATSVFKAPIKAQYIRIHPVTWHDYISLQMEILGCQVDVSGQLGQFDDIGLRPPTTIKPAEATTSTTTTPVPVTLPVPTKCEPSKLIPISSILPDSSFTGSSDLSDGFLPKYGRLNSKPSNQSSGSWSPKQSDPNQFMQIAFPNKVPIFGITIKGSPLYDSYVKSFKVLQSDDGVTFKPLLDDFGSPQIFSGGNDSKTPATSIFKAPIEAKYIRVNPVTWNVYIALQVEVIGCQKNVSGQVGQLGDTGFRPPPTTVKPIETTTTTPAPVTLPVPTQCEPTKLNPISTILPDNLFSASSQLSDAFQPKYSRLNSKPVGQSSGSWSPQQSSQNEYLQIMFPSKVPIYGVTIKGSPLFDQYVTSFKVLQSNDGVTFKPLLDEFGSPKIFTGSKDSKSPATSVFRTPIEAQYIRIYPVTWHDYISLQVELLGCQKDVSGQVGQLGDTGFRPPPTTVKPIETTTTPIPVIIIPTIAAPITSPPIPMCDDPMGVENGNMHPSQVTFSSSKESATAKKNPLSIIKLSSQKGWMPLVDSSNEYIMFDFLGPSKLTGLITKGGDYGWVKSFNIMYSKDNVIWNYILDDESEKPKIFLANVDTENPKTNFFKFPINAQYLKVKPLKWYNMIEMKVEPLGCFKFYPEVTTTTISPKDEVEIITPSGCGKCDGVLEPTNIMQDACLCYAPQYWNGQECVPRSQCPCMVGHMSFNVGEHYQTEDCSECICTLGGIPQCTPKKCEPCKVGTRRVYPNSCSCKCEPCPKGTLICQTSGECIPEENWCDGIRDCPDDEVGCIKSVEPEIFEKHEQKITIIKKCPVPECPPGFQLREKPPAKPRMQSRFSDGFDDDDIGVSDPKFYYVKAKYQASYEAFLPISATTHDGNMKEKCLEFICIPKYEDVAPDYADGEEKRITRCPEPKCPKGYLIKLQVARSPTECANFTCERAPEEDAVCNVTGRTFNTFDGTEFKFDICSHLLARDIKDEKWNVIMRKNCSTGNFVCTKEVEIKDKVSPHTVILYPSMDVSIDGYKFSVQQLQNANQGKKSTYVVSKVGSDSLLYVSHIHGIWVIFDRFGDVKLGISASYLNEVDGLCGYFNKNKTDDKRTPTGTIAPSTEEFGSTWSLNQISSDKCIPHACPQALQDKAWDMCNLIKHEVFSQACGTAVDAAKFISKCLETACDCLLEASNGTSVVVANKEKDCKCSMLKNFAVECMAADETVHLDTWRTVHGCESTCTLPFIHRDCYRKKCEPTCENIKNNDCTIVPGTCFSGCYCPEGKVRKGNTCIPISDCRDCVCDGFGKSQYLTYDRQNFTFDGNCTYLLTRDLVVPNVPTFQIFVTIGECVGTKNTTCTQSLHIMYGTHIIHVQRSPSNKLDVLIDGLKVQKLPYNENWIQIKEMGQELNILLPESQVELLSRFETMSFSIKVPSLKYASKMEGLCGNCNGDPKDDIQVNMKRKTKVSGVKDPLKAFALSWLADEPKLGLSEQVCQVNDEAQCMPLPPETDPCFKILDETLFGKCHLIVDPIMYVTACQQDLCRTGPTQKGACSSIEAYARECARNGICVNWRVNGFCSMECSAPFIYSHCGCMETCENVKNKLTKQKTSSCVSGEGCFCPKGTALIKGRCVTERECTPCDDKNHYPGDKWYPDVCTECTCKNDTTISCSKTVCPVGATLCGLGFVSVETVVPGQCCKKYTCIPETPKVLAMECPKQALPKCAENQINKVINGTDGCPKYICDCIPKAQCKPPQNYTSLQPGFTVYTDNSGCCPVSKLVCDKSKCPPKPAYCAEEFYTVEKLVTPPDACCEEFKCVAPKSSCIVVINGKKVLKKVDEVWTTTDPCVTEMCSFDTNGNPTIKQKKETCVNICELGFEIVPVIGKCCGQCVQTQCIVGDKTYEVGQTWKLPQDNCTEYTCELKNSQPVISGTSEVCPDASHCAEHLKYQEGCCTKCKLEPLSQKNCFPQTISESLSIGYIKYVDPEHGTCKNIKPVKGIAECVGSCKSGTKFNFLTLTQERYCDCCAAAEITVIPIELVCDDNFTSIKNAPVPVSCTCSACSSEREIKLLKSIDAKA